MIAPSRGMLEELRGVGQKFKKHLRIVRENCRLPEKRNFHMRNRRQFGDRRLKVYGEIWQVRRVNFGLRDGAVCLRLSIRWHLESSGKPHRRHDHFSPDLPGRL